jgi:small GTP-binding protein
MWTRVQDVWRNWFSRADNRPQTTEEVPGEAGDRHLALARESLSALMADDRVPDRIRDALQEDYQAVRSLLDKIENGAVHIAAFGRVSTGKSSLLNALTGEPRFAVSPLHGDTRRADMQSWEEYDSGGVYLIDTPGLGEWGGESREATAQSTARRADIVLFVADGDLTRSELAELESIRAAGRPVVLVLNKMDLHTADERALLRSTVSERVGDLVSPQDIVQVSASPVPVTVIQEAADGSETESLRLAEPDVAALKTRIWEILERDGKSLCAINASVFAGQLSDEVARHLIDARRLVAERVVRTYCLAKGVAVAVNPIPVADILAAASIDAGLVVHLARVYDLPLNRTEAGSLVRVILTQLAALMGTVWAVHLASSALKLGTGGLSVIVTAGAQGAIAYYSTYVVGKVAEAWLAGGKSWGEGGPKLVVRRILDDVDRDSVLSQARDEILASLGSDGLRESKT